MKIIIKDGVKYFGRDYRDEAELESEFWSHADAALGAKLVLLPKTKIRSAGDIASIPDGYAIDFTHKTWYVIEVELAKHPVYDHIVPQVSKFYTAIRNPGTRRKLLGILYDLVGSDAAFHGDTHKALWDIIESDPVFVIVIDKVTTGLIEAKDSLPGNPCIIEFQTFAGEGDDGAAKLHVFDVLRDPRDPSRETPPELPAVPESRPRAREVPSVRPSGSAKAPRVSFRELATADLLAEGQTLYLCNRQRQRVGQEAAVVRIDQNRLEYGAGRLEKTSPLALELLKKYREVAASLEAVQGPLYWMTKDGRTLDDLNAEVRRRKK